MSHVLLGNSFLSRFQMKRENDLMVLDHLDALEQLGATIQPPVRAVRT